MLEHLAGLYVLFQQLAVVDGCHHRRVLVNGTHPAQDAIFKFSKALAAQQERTHSGNVSSSSAQPFIQWEAVQ